jgi:molecular chaperone DnaJ
METQEAYKELGLDPSATDAQLKASWRKLVAAWHPDRNAAAGAGSRMQSINKAYQHIRQLRDGLLDDEDEDTGGARAAAQAAAADKAQSEASGHTHVRKVRLSLEEAILGCTRSLRGHFTHSCSACVGTGQRVLAKACSTCGGNGAVRKAALFGWLWNEESCADCGGDGRQRAACDSCAGLGEINVPYRRQVRFPAGLRTGQVLSVPKSRHGELEIGLELHLEIEPHAFFTLGDDGVLRCEMPVNGYAWMAGRWVEVPTPDGLQQMRLNRDALVYRMAGQGFPTALRGPRGDYMVKVLPLFPTQEDATHEALLEQLIASTSRAAEADRNKPLGLWKRKLKRWNSGKAAGEA